MEGCKEAKKMAVSGLTPRCASVRPRVPGAVVFVLCSWQIPRLLWLAGEFVNINLIN